MGDHADIATLKCAGAACAADPDDATCCVAKATCDSLTCTAATHVPKATRSYCAAAACVTDPDESTCCDPKATCDSLTCTAATHVSKANPTRLYCAAAECDDATCCV